MIRCHVCGKRIPSPAHGIARISGQRVVLSCSPACAGRAGRGHGWEWFLHAAADRIAGHPSAPPAWKWGATAMLLVVAFFFLTFIHRNPSQPVPHEKWSFFASLPSPSPPAAPERSMVEPQPQAAGLDAPPKTTRAPEAPPTDPVSARERAREVLEESLKVQQPSLWDMDALEVLAQDNILPAVNRLRQLLQGETGPIRRRAAVALARAGIRDGIDILRAEMASPNPMLAALSAMELGRLGDARALPVLKRFMDRSDMHMAACEAALHLRYEPARLRLLQTAHTAARTGDRVRAALALARAGERQVTDILLAGFEDNQFRFMAALGLAALGDARAVPLLRLALEHTALRLEAAAALARFNETRAYETLVRDMESTHAPTRISAAAAVYLLTVPAHGKGAAHG